MFKIKACIVWSPTGIVGEIEEGGENYYIWTHKKFDIGVNGNQIVDVNLTSETKVKLKPGSKMEFSYEASMFRIVFKPIVSYTRVHAHSFVLRSQYRSNTSIMKSTDRILSVRQQKGQNIICAFVLSWTFATRKDARFLSVTFVFRIQIMYADIINYSRIVWYLVVTWHQKSCAHQLDCHLLC